MIRLLIVCSAVCLAQTGVIHGTITLDAIGDPMHGTRVVLPPLGRTTDTADGSTYEFRDVANADDIL
jgi:hypothetical protein